MSTIQLPLVLDVANGHESYTSLNGTVQTLSLTDKFISDNKGVISSIIYGPDNRTPIKSDTSEVIFTVYGPEGISSQQMMSHLEDIRSFVYLVSPDAYTGTLEIISG